MLISTVCVPVAPAGTLTRPSDEPSGQLEPLFQERSSQTSSPAAPPEIEAQAMPEESTCSAMSRPLSVVSGTGSVFPVDPLLAAPSQREAQTCACTQGVHTTPFASPQARTTARRWFDG